MNLIYQLRNLFTPRREAALPAPASSCKELLSNLDQLCARLPEGEALLITGDGEFTVRLTWKPQTEKPARRTFSLNGHNEAVEWIEDGDTTEENKTEEQKDRKESKQRQMMQRLSRYLKLHYAFRYNLLTERTECARLDTEAVDDSRCFFRRVSSSKRSLLNSFKYAFSILSLSSSSSSSLTCSALVSTGFSPSYLEGFLHSLISNVFLRPFFLGLKASGPAILKSLTHFTINDGLLIPCDSANS